MDATQADDAPAVTAKHGSNSDAAPVGDTMSASVVTINRPVGEVFTYFRDLANLPNFMENVVSIDTVDAKRSHWVVKAPAGKTVEWDATVTQESPNSLLCWESEADADVPNSGRIEFRDAGPRGTIVTATIAYDPPGGFVGKVIAKMFQREPAIQARRDLRRFKQLMETGEIATAAFTRQQLEEEAA